MDSRKTPPIYKTVSVLNIKKGFKSMFEKPGLVCDKATSVGYSLRKEKKKNFIYEGFLKQQLTTESII